MEENGSCLPPQTRVSCVRAIHKDVSGRPPVQSRSWKEATWGPKLPFAKAHLWTLATLALFLCSFTSTEASLSLPCPDECLCSTLNKSFGNFSLVIDCSNGGLQSISSINDSQNSLESIIAQNIEMVRGGGNDSTAKSNETQFSTTGNNETIENGNNQGNKNELIIELDMSFNNISSHQLQYLLSREAAVIVQRLNLSNNRIDTFEKTSLLYFVSLVSLDLSNNHVNNFSPQVFQHFPILQYLYLNGNEIVHIQSAINSDLLFKALPTLADLDLSSNLLGELPARAFSSFPMLTSLNLSHNRISKMNHFAFAGLSELKSLHLSHNSFNYLDYPVFQNTSLIRLSLAGLPNMTAINHDVLKGLEQLQYLNLSQNKRLEFINPNILSDLKSLEVIDISESGILQLSPITFQSNLQLKDVYLKNIPLTCQCINAWLAEEQNKNVSIFQDVNTLRCTSPKNNKSMSLQDALFPCTEVVLHNMTQELSISIGSPLMLRCKQASSSKEEILTWKTPQGRVFYLHDYHPNASQHLLSEEDVKLDSSFHKNHPWHRSSSYYSDLDYDKDRILILSDGSLFIDYILRSDAGPYTCTVRNAHYNSSGITFVTLGYTISTEIKLYAIIAGFLCALAFFTLNLLYVIISWIARRLVNKRRREHIHQMLENMNNYKSTQIARIHENYTSQLNRVRNRYHSQRDRLNRNYSMQVDRVKRGCSHQVEKVRENYNSKLTNLREYSSNQIVQIRDIANTQIGRIRDYGSLQLDRLRETYKLQQQHVLKLLDTMNLDNCKSIIETECMRTESMMYDLDLLSQEDERTDSAFSLGDSEYNTAASSPVMSTDLKESLQENNMYQLPHDTIQIYDTVTRDNGDENFAEALENPSETQIFSHIPNEKNMPTGHSLCRRDDIEIEMNTSLPIADNYQLNSKEVSTHQNTLYTINQQGIRNSVNFQTDPMQEIKNNQGKGNTGELVPDEIMDAVCLPCMDFNNQQLSCGSPETDSPLWESGSAERAESPTKTWLQPKSFFPNENEDMATVCLYDAEVHEEEKTESDTMV